MDEDKEWSSLRLTVSSLDEDSQILGFTEHLSDDPLAELLD